MVRRVVVERFGATDVLDLRSVDIPSPARGEILVSVQYAGVAYSDLLMRMGDYPGGPRPPYTPGWDVVGTVEAVGEEVDQDLLGRTVVGLTFLGGYASHALVPVDRIAIVPAEVDPQAAACLTLNYVTAWQMLRRVADAQAGESVLVHGAAGGVGSAVLDLAAALDLIAYGVAAQEKAAAVRRYRATHLSNAQQTADVAAKIGGFDIILDPIGGRETWRGMRLLAPGGRLVNYGFTGMLGRGPIMPRIALHLLALKVRSLLAGDRRAVFYRVSTAARRAASAFREDLMALLDLLAANRIAPLVDDVLLLGQAAEAHRRLESRTVQGKLLLNMRA
ncbi:hypothetical protein CLG96_03540 [Sphingomonas oleivorans]|uniref:Enoyl reductase (ER) domain-containing protein n=1 Tax=Sphingomonas oleivorans TaxID=1735121 RepID=A0A2T5G244_9SPHN|nr:zinc-binding dehydrogenase [Sphingomonas oleivorans]PTQ13206.1 hypothetical protein CLG96_03540 [Sphingomonas oleivorans]